MAVLWQHGSGTVSEVRDLLDDELAYTTVLTVLRNLEEKGFVRHEAEGRAHRYFPRVAQRAARRSAVQRLVQKLFAGSSEQLVTQLVEDEALDAEQLKRLREALGADRRGR